jgi:hypothetical protein
MNKEKNASMNVPPLGPFESSIHILADDRTPGHYPFYEPEEGDLDQEDDDGDSLIPEEEDQDAGALHPVRDNTEQWFTNDGGLTAEAYEWLADQDNHNGFC